MRRTLIGAFIVAVAVPAAAQERPFLFSIADLVGSRSRPRDSITTSASASARSRATSRISLNSASASRRRSDG